jgi:hypothetical protein
VGRFVSGPPDDLVGFVGLVMGVAGIDVHVGLAAVVGGLAVVGAHDSGVMDVDVGGVALRHRRV